MSISDMFSAISRKAAAVAGSWQASILAIVTVVAWTLGGSIFGFTDTYQLIINTGTTIITFVMVFLIQGSSNRDQKTLQVKLNEIISVLEKADNRLIDIEQDTDEHIEAVRQQICSRKDAP